MPSRSSSDAAAEAARRAAEAARRAAEAARRAAAEAAQRAAAEAAAKQAKPQVKLQRDELSTGRGSALVARGLNATGAASALPQLDIQARTFSPTEVQASSLRTEVLNDGRENCLEQAVEFARTGDQVLLFANEEGPVGHAVVQLHDGTVVDPSDNHREYDSVADYRAAHEGLADPLAISDTDAERVLATPPGAERNGLLRELGLDGIANRAVAGLWDDVQDVGGALVDAGRDGLETVGDGLERVGGWVDGFIDGVIPQGVQDIIDRLPPMPQTMALQQMLHAGENIEQFGQTIADLPEFADAITQAASYRAHIRNLGPGDSITMGAGGDLSVEGITGALSGEVSITRNDDGTYTMSVNGEIGAGVGGPLAEGVEGSATINAGAGLEFTFDNVDDAVRGADILMSTAATAATGVLGSVADATGITRRIFGASSRDLNELLQQKSAATVSLSAEVAAEFAVQAGIDVDIAASATHELQLQFDDNGDVSGVVLSSTLKGSASGTVAEGPNGVNAGVSGSITIEQGFTVEEGTSVAELLRHPSRLQRDDDATITFGAEVFGGSSAGVTGSSVTAQLNDNEGLEASLSFSGNPAEILRSGAAQKALQGDFQGAIDSLDGAGLTAALEFRHFTATGVEAELGGGAAGTGASVGVSIEHRDYDDSPIFEFEGNLGDVQNALSRRITNAEDFARSLYNNYLLANIPA